MEAQFAALRPERFALNQDDPKGSFLFLYYEIDL